MHNILSRLVGISALKPVSRNIGNSQRNRRKTVEKLRNKKEIVFFFKFNSIFNKLPTYCQIAIGCQTKLMRKFLFFTVFFLQTIYYKKLECVSILFDFILKELQINIV